MFCRNCGKSNPGDASFCQKCGMRLVGDDETRVAFGTAPGLQAGAETVIFSVGPSLVFVKAGYLLAASMGIALVAALTAVPVSAAISVPLGLAVLLVPAYRHLRRRLVRYTLTDSKIEIDAGFIVQNSRNVPLRSIQDVFVTSTLLQRSLGFGDVVIDNASEDGGKIVLKDIPQPKKHADMLLSALRHVGR